MAFSRVSHPKESLQVVTPALRTAANLVTGDDMQTDFFLRSKPWDAGFFSGFILGIHVELMGMFLGIPSGKQTYRNWKMDENGSFKSMIYLWN